MQIAREPLSSITTYSHVNLSSSHLVLKPETADLPLLAQGRRTNPCIDITGLTLHCGTENSLIYARVVGVEFHYSRASMHVCACVRLRVCVGY